MLRRTNPVARKVVSNFLREPTEKRTYEQTMEYCNAQNVDMASQLSSDFLLVQSKLVKYRIARLGEECRYIAKHPFGSFPAFKDLLVHCVALPVVFVLAMWLGRYSISPLVPPPQAEQPAAPAKSAETTAEATGTEGEKKENAVA